MRSQCCAGYYVGPIARQTFAQSAANGGFEPKADMASARQMFGLANIAKHLSSKILPKELVSADSDLGGFPWKLLELAYQPLETHRLSG